MNYIDWSAAPEWANYVAMDYYDGKWYWFSHKPEPTFWGKWSKSKDPCHITEMSPQPPHTVGRESWESTLQSRPKTSNSRGESPMKHIDEMTLSELRELKSNMEKELRSAISEVLSKYCDNSGMSPNGIYVSLLPEQKLSKAGPDYVVADVEVYTDLL